MNVVQAFAVTLALAVTVWTPAAHAQSGPDSGAGAEEPQSEPPPPSAPGADSPARSASISRPVARLLDKADGHLEEGRPAVAQAVLQRAVARAGAEDDRAGRTAAAKKLGALLASTARLRIDASRLPLDAYLLVEVDGALVAAEDWALPLFVEPGPRVVEIRRPGCGEYKTEVTAERGHTSDIVVPALSCGETVVAPVKLRDVSEAPVPFARPTLNDDVDGSPYMIGAIGAGAGGIAVGVVALIYASSAADNKEEAEALGCFTRDCSDLAGRARYRSYEGDRKVAIATGVVTGVGLTAAIVCGITAYKYSRKKKRSRKRAPSRLSVAPARGGAVFGWTGSF